MSLLRKVICVFLWATCWWNTSCSVAVPNKGAPVNLTPIETDLSVPAKYEVLLKVSPVHPSNATHTEIEHITALLTKHLSIINKRAQMKLDEEQEHYLVLDVPQEIQQILETEGYFNSHVSINSNITSKGKTYNIYIGLTQPVRIHKTEIVLSGTISEDQHKQKYYNNIAVGWRLSPQDIFKQDQWNLSKNFAVKELHKHKYPLASIKNSSVQIDINNHSALLHLEIESGTLVKFGPLLVSGADRYPESLIKNLATFQQGDDFNQELLSDYQQQLERDGHYSEVVITPLFGQIAHAEVPILVSVKEQLNKSFDLELIYDSDDKLGGAIAYQHNNFLSKGYVSSITANYNKYEQEISLGITQPKKSNGRFWTARTNYFRGARNGFNTLLRSAGMWYVYTGRMIDTRFGLEYYQEKLKTKTGPKLNNNNTLMFTYYWKVDRINTWLRPENGYYIAVEIGTTLGQLASSSSVQRYAINADYYLTPWTRQQGTFLLKSQIGYVATKEFTRVPDELKFKIGGVGSVRGYVNDSIGIKKDRYTFGGRAKLAATVEYQKPVTDNVSLAVFHDIGDVKNTFKDMQFKYGTGVGVRWFNMVAPLSFDAAYTHQRKKIAWHLNLGSKF